MTDLETSQNRSKPPITNHPISCCPFFCCSVEVFLESYPILSSKDRYLLLVGINHKIMFSLFRGSRLSNFLGKGCAVPTTSFAFRNLSVMQKSGDDANEWRVLPKDQAIEILKEQCLRRNLTLNKKIASQIMVHGVDDSPP